MFYKDQDQYVHNHELIAEIEIDSHQLVPCNMAGIMLYISMIDHQLRLMMMDQYIHSYLHFMQIQMMM